MSEPVRPLSPFLHYQWRHTNTLSMLHRITGLPLLVGLLLLVCWLMAVARGAGAYARTSAVTVTLVVLTFAHVLVAAIGVFAVLKVALGGAR